MLFDCSVRVADCALLEYLDLFLQSLSSKNEGGGGMAPWLLHSTAYD